MKYHYLLVLLVTSLLGLTLSACSDSSNSDAKSENTSGTSMQTPAQAPSQTQQNKQTLSPSQQAAVSAARGLPKQGKVLEMMHASGYTYMNVDAGSGEPMWIAATMMRVKPQQKVSWTDAAVMNNFNSKSLHRTFSKILFVSNAKVIE